MIKEKTYKMMMEDEIVPEYMEPIKDRLPEFILIRNTYSCAIREISTKLDNLDAEFRVRYDYNPIHHMDSRLKTAKSILEKMERYGLEVSLDNIREITDVAGVRVVCNYIDDVYELADLILKQDDIKLIKKRDYIKKPKASGYRSLHLVVEVPVFLSDRREMVPVEIQLRTIAMDTWASLEHELKYKRKGELTEEISKELIACAEAMADIDRTMERIHKIL